MKRVNFFCAKIFIVLSVCMLGCIFLNSKCVLSCDSFTLCDGFSYENLPDDYEILVGNKAEFENNKYIRREDLKLLKIKYIDFNGEVRNGELVVAHQTTDPQKIAQANTSETDSKQEEISNDPIINSETEEITEINTENEIIDVSKEVLEIFKELFDAEYPINTISCFCFRNIAGTDRLSWHAYGLAVDINYKQNPYVAFDESTNKITKLIPNDSEKYVDRTLNEKGMIKEDDVCHKAFVSRGWEWVVHGLQTKTGCTSRDFRGMHLDHCRNISRYFNALVGFVKKSLQIRNFYDSNQVILD